jgi:hypothetical protein
LQHTQPSQLQASETEDSAVPGDCERCVNAVISIFSDFSIKVSISLGYDKIPTLVDVCDSTKPISPQALAEIQDK